MFTNYLTEEVVEDYTDGISRREALRRLGMLGVGTAVAVPLLAACSVAGDGGTAENGNREPGRFGSCWTIGQPAEAITFDGPDNRTLQGAWSSASKPRGAVVVVHENRGLTDHIRSVAGRLAISGYSALAVDLLSEEGGTASFKGEAEVAAALNQIPDSRLVADMKAAISELERRAADAKIGVVGFCFGGGMVWSLLASGEPPPRRCGPVLRSTAGRRRFRWLTPGRCPRYLRRAGRPGECDQETRQRRRWRKQV